VKVGISKLGCLTRFGGRFGRSAASSGGCFDDDDGNGSFQLDGNFLAGLDPGILTGVHTSESDTDG
jgi:hypothetical protein